MGKRPLSQSGTSPQARFWGWGWASGGGKPLGWARQHWGPDLAGRLQGLRTLSLAGNVKWYHLLPKVGEAFSLYPHAKNSVWARLRDSTNMEDINFSLEKAKLETEYISKDFPGGSVGKKPPANAGDVGLVPDPGRSHMPQSNWAPTPQRLSLCSRTWQLQSLSLWVPEPELYDKRSHHSVKPARCSWKVAPARHN